MPAFEPEAVALLLPVAPVVEELLPAAPAGEALLAPETPAELGEAAAEVRGVDVVEAAPPVPKLTEPIASWTLNGGAGITPLRTWLARPDELPAEVLAPAAAEGAALLPAPAAPLAAGRALLVLEVDVLLLPVALVPPLELPLVLPFAMQAGFAAEVAPPVAPAALDGRDDGLVAGRVLAAVDAAGLVLAAPLAAVLGAVIGPVLVLGAALPPPPPQAASTSDAAASVGRSGRIVMDGFLRVGLATTPGEILVPEQGPSRCLQHAQHGPFSASV